jgi:transposase-like protein
LKGIREIAMTDETLDGTGGPARGHYAVSDAPVPQPRRRMSAKRKQSAVLRLLTGEPIALVSRELGVTAAQLAEWRDAFLVVGEGELKPRPADDRDAEIARLKGKVGDLTMANEPLEAKIEKLEGSRPWSRGRSRR